MAVISNGTTLINAGALDSAVPTGSMVHIKTLTASSSATLSFVDGASSVVLDGTYKKYVFKFIDIHPATDDQSFTFQGSTNTGGAYGVNITSTSFRTYQQENDGGSGLGYLTDYDLAQSTGFQRLGQTVGNANDECFSGQLFLFDPSNTTFVKHFIARNVHAGYADYVGDGFTAGYFNTTSAIDAIQFKFASGNIDSGTIKLYGIK